VFVAEDGYAKRRVVQVGQRNGLIAQILDGLTEDEIVINHPNDAVDEGKRITQR
jgi:HlyD family secretion protein